MNASLFSRRSLVAGAAALALLVPSAALAGTLSASGKPKIAFYAVGNPGFLDIEGTTSDLSVKDDGTNLTFDVKLSTVTTGIELRDEHMKDKFLQVGTHPNATLVLPRASVQWPTELGKSTTGSVDAQFTAHGVTQPAKVEYTIRKSKTGHQVKAKFAFDISKHGVEVPSYLGVTVDAKMRSEVTIDLAEAP